jgi:uncharacterized sulfatase
MMPDIFATALSAAGVPAPADRPIDGKDILPLLTAGAKSPHEAIFAMRGPRLSVVRSGKWKLHLEAQGKPRIWKKEDSWEDPRAPDGVTILAPYEQAHPSEYPGVLTGDDTKATTLFDLESDPSEQRDVSREHPDVVKRLQALHEEMKKQMPRAAVRGE